MEEHIYCVYKHTAPNEKVYSGKLKTAYGYIWRYAEGVTV